MSLKKQYLKRKPLCKVTFRLPKQAVESACAVNLVGDFNNWSTNATPMKKLKSGEFKAIVDLEIEKEYQFRYLIDDNEWENDWHADKYTPNAYGNCENSVVVV